jgi:hypothetical protein
MPKLIYTTPPPSLMIELREVAADARALANALVKFKQSLSSDFPVEQLQELLDELQSLPDGTAEGCRQPLEYVRVRLPAIRRRFIQTEEQSRQPRENKDQRPPPTRGMAIDQHIGVLLSSVATALDEYRELASVDVHDPADGAPSREIDATSRDAIQAMAASEGAEKRLSLGVEQVEKIAEATSATADSLKRQMRDARGLLRIARIELRMPGFVPRWYRNTIDIVRDYPKLLQKTARAIRIGVDVARPLADAWSHFEHGFKHLVLDSIEHAAMGLEAVGKKWAADRDNVKVPPAKAAVELDAPPPGFSISKIHQMIISGQAPPPSWRPWIKQLNFLEPDLRGLKDLAPIAGLTALQTLSLTGTQVGDLAPIAGLTALQALYLDNTQVGDLAPISGLGTLQRLDLDGTQVGDLAPIAGLTALQTLYLTGTRVSDLAPLARLYGLQRLSISGTQVGDIAPLAGLAALRTLFLNNTQVNDLAPLAGLSALQRLYLDRTRIIDLAPLADLAALETLSLEDTKVIDIAPLSGLRSLQTLYLSRTQVSDLAPLDRLSGWRFVVTVESEKRREALQRTLRPEVVRVKP